MSIARKHQKLIDSIPEIKGSWHYNNNTMKNVTVIRTKGSIYSYKYNPKTEEFEAMTESEDEFFTVTPFGQEWLDVVEQIVNCELISLSFIELVKSVNEHRS